MTATPPDDGAGKGTAPGAAPQTPGAAPQTSGDAPEAPLAARWGRFIAVALVVAAVLIGVVMVLNLLTDVRGVFGIDIFPPRVRQDRATKADLVAEMKQPPELLIFGSSRAWTLEAARVEQATGRRTFNAAVTAGRPADAYLFTRVLRDTWPQAEPDFVWLLDVESFSWEALSPALFADARFSRHLSWEDRTTARLDEVSWIASWRGLRQSWGVWKQWPDREKVRAAWLKRISPDGTVKTTASKWAGAAPKAVAGWKKDEVPRYRRFARLDPEVVAYVEQTLELFASWGGSGVVALTPMQPEVLAAVEPEGEPRRRAEVLRLLERLQTQYDFTVVDMTDISSFDGDPDGFFDATHMTIENQRLMIDALLARAGGRLD